MQLFDRTFPELAANLACDEALLDWRDMEFDDDILRFWEPREHFVVLGYSSRIRSDVELPSCRSRGIPIFRRCSGGGTVLQGPGCLNFSLVMRTDGASPLATVAGTTRFVMETHRAAMERLLGSAVQVAGFSDLVTGGFKFSGNAQRRKRRTALFHGTFLLDLDLALVEDVLPVPVRQPEYRRNRAHREFLKNVPLPAPLLKQELAAVWGAGRTLSRAPLERIQRLARDVYATEDWTFRL